MNHLTGDVVFDIVTRAIHPQPLPRELSTFRNIRDRQPMRKTARSTNYCEYSPLTDRIDDYFGYRDLFQTAYNILYILYCLFRCFKPIDKPKDYRDWRKRQSGDAEPLQGIDEDICRRRGRHVYRSVIRKLDSPLVVTTENGAPQTATVFHVLPSGTPKSQIPRRRNPTTTLSQSRRHDATSHN